jgi:hypothetical protein
VFAKRFWNWWKSLQPSWREVSEVLGPLTSTHQTMTGDWTVLDKPGLNGFFMVLTVLSWWGQAILQEEDCGEQTNAEWVAAKAEWVAACEDVQWVMGSML